MCKQDAQRTTYSHIHCESNNDTLIITNTGYSQAMEQPALDTKCLSLHVFPLYNVHQTVIRRVQSSNTRCTESHTSVSTFVMLVMSLSLSLSELSSSVSIGFTNTFGTLLVSLTGCVQTKINNRTSAKSKDNKQWSYKE